MGPIPVASLISSQAPATKCVGLLRLLHAADCFPRGGLYSGYYAVAAAMRYERLWVEIMKTYSGIAVPPLDIAFAWFVHRQDPASYHADLVEKGVSVVHLTASKAFAFGSRPSDRTTWKSVADKHPAWPPPAPGSTHGSFMVKTTAFAAKVAADMSRFSQLLRSWLRPHFLDITFLNRAQERYVRFLELHADHPGLTLVPTADIALVWHTHLGLSGDYAAACGEIFGRQVEPWRPEYLHMGDPAQLAAAYGETARLYMQKYGEPYDDPDTAWLSDAVPYPLATAANPLAYTLRLFDDNPQLNQQQAAIASTCAAAGIPVPQPGAPVLRSGAHALYSAWLAARRAEQAYDDLTCNRCCWTSSDRVYANTLKDVTASLVSIAYFLELPDIDTHPYLLGISLQAGRWKPGSSTAPPPGAGGPSPAAIVGFSASDPENYLSGRESRSLKGLTPVLEAAMSPAAAQGVAQAHTSDSPLWHILESKGMAARAGGYCTSAWTTSISRSVGTMQHVYQQRHRRHEGCYVYGSSDYYTFTTLYMSGVAYNDYYYYGGPAPLPDREEWAKDHNSLGIVLWPSVAR
ncbi:hypothetical protein PLESTB_000556200 [Pleodorina starrii]|uniref:Uncharacterized protein n=1 Tax=Pleodorina starrii TaxID=330485 RepID=A0A9W6BGT2_9CHLO|nr:hypothetical protein PLESTB_000556200 [Pleodorina starrii]GLC74540.1 hypothetical protein PLESTF_001525000 [Pleodorina starrii]